MVKTPYKRILPGLHRVVINGLRSINIGSFDHSSYGCLTRNGAPSRIRLRGSDPEYGWLTAHLPEISGTDALMRPSAFWAQLVILSGRELPNICESRSALSLCIYMYIYIYACMYLCIYIYIYTYIGTHMLICVYACTGVRLRVHTYMYA